MSLFTTPLVLSDGVDLARSFDWQMQVPGEYTGKYYEPAAVASAASFLLASHTTSKAGTKRHLLQRVETCALVDPGPEDPSGAPITVNITVNHHPLASAADIEKQVLLAIGAASVAGFTASFINGNI